MAVSNVLKRRRKELDYTLLDIAKKVGVSEATVQRWESGNIKNLRYDKIIALSDVLKITPSQLMGWSAEPIPTMNTGERIKCYRKQLGMSAEDLAAIINVSPSTIYRYENNDISNMGIDKLQAIASALHTHAYSLMGWGADPAQDSPKVIYIMNQLNEEGQRKVIDYAEDLVASGKYSPSSPLSPSRARKADKNADIETENIMNEFEKLRALSDD